MLDDHGSFAGAAAKEMEEETEIKIEESELVDLTELAYGDRYPGLYPSAGGCDEHIRLFAFRADVSAEKLESLRGKETGLRTEERELITLRVVPLAELWRHTSDAKSLACLHLYERLGGSALFDKK